MGKPVLSLMMIYLHNIYENGYVKTRNTGIQGACAFIGKGVSMVSLYIISGIMGVGKTAVCQQLKKLLSDSVFLDRDWCWDADPFYMTEETKKMVMDNICHILNNFLHCSAYQNVIFGWVMHEQTIIHEILARLDVCNCRVFCISLMADENNLKRRLEQDIAMGIRSEDIVEEAWAGSRCISTLTQ